MKSNCVTVTVYLTDTKGFVLGKPWHHSTVISERVSAINTELAP